MADSGDDFHLELDEETLRQIEEEARRKVDAELLDEQLLEDLPSERARDEGIDDFEINAAMMREIEAEARRLLAEEGFDLDDEEEPAPAAEVPAAAVAPVVATAVRPPPPVAAAVPPPLPATSAVAENDEADAEGAEEAVGLPSAPVRGATARREAIDRARERAEEKAREKAHSRTRQGTAVKLKTETHRRAISDISVPPEPASSKTMIIIVSAVFLLMVGIAIGVGQLTKNPEPKTDPAVAVEGGAANSVAPRVSAEEQTRADWDEMQIEIKKIVRAGQTADNLEKAIGLLEEFKSKHADYADLCDKDIKRYRSTLDFIKHGGG